MRLVHLIHTAVKRLIFDVRLLMIHHCVFSQCVSVCVKVFVDEYGGDKRQIMLGIVRDP